jgi:hypothetical protein
MFKRLGYTKLFVPSFPTQEVLDSLEFFTPFRLIRSRIESASSTTRELLRRG